MIEVDGVQVHHFEAGVGTPVVLIHGNGVSAEDFVVSGLFDRLGETFDAITCPFCGLSHLPARTAWRYVFKGVAAHLKLYGQPAPSHSIAGRPHQR